MKNTSLSQLLSPKMAIAILMSATLANAYAESGQDKHHRNMDDHRRGHYSDSYSSSHRDSQRISERVNRYLNEGEKINIIRELRLRRELEYGKKIVSISVDAQSTERRSKLILIMDGQTIGQANLSSTLAPAVFTIPSFTVPTKLKLKVIGGAFISTVSADLRDSSSGDWSYPSQNLNLQANLNQWLEGRQIVPVGDLIQRSNPGAQVRGMSLTKIVLIAESSSDRGHHRRRGRRGHHGRRGRHGGHHGNHGHGGYGLAEAQLLINGMPVGYPQTITERETSLHFLLPENRRNVIGEEIRSVDLQITGDIYARTVVAELQSSSVSPLRAVLNRSFYGSERLTLAQLLQSVRGVSMNAPVESITFVTRGHGTIAVAGMGTVQGTVRVDRRTSSGSVRVVNQASLSQLSMRISGRVTIEEVRVNFKSNYSRY